MSDPTSRSENPLVEQVVEKVEARPSVDADHEEVVERAATAVDDLADRPVQTFTPLLAENRVVDELTGRDTGDADSADSADSADGRHPSG